MRRRYSNHYSKIRKQVDKKIREEKRKKNPRLNTGYTPATIHGIAGAVYGLYATDDPENIRYVGATTASPKSRLCSHKNGQTSRKVRMWITEVQNRGADIGMEVLDYYEITELSPAEAAWTLYFQENGNILNSGIRSSHLRKSL